MYKAKHGSLPSGHHGMGEIAIGEKEKKTTYSDSMWYLHPFHPNTVFSPQKCTFLPPKKHTKMQQLPYIYFWRNYLANARARRHIKETAKYPLRLPPSLPPCVCAMIKGRRGGGGGGCVRHNFSTFFFPPPPLPTA